MSKKSVKVSAEYLAGIGNGEIILHLKSNSGSRDIKVGDSIVYKNGKKERSRKVVSVQNVHITNRPSRYPNVMIVNSGEEGLYLPKRACDDLARKAGFIGVPDMILKLKVKPGQTLKCKIMHHTEFKY